MRRTAYPNLVAQFCCTEPVFSSCCTFGVQVARTSAPATSPTFEARAVPASRRAVRMAFSPVSTDHMGLQQKPVLHCIYAVCSGAATCWHSAAAVLQMPLTLDSAVCMSS
jgi:hypothetical protein